MIKSIEVKNFKSINNLNIDLPNFGAIVGKNGAGKTNFIQSLSFAKGLVLGHVIQELQKNYSLVPNELFFNNNSTRDININVVISTKTQHELSLEITISFDDKKRSLVVNEEKLSVREGDRHTTVYHRKFEDITNESGKKIPLEVYEYELVVSKYKSEYASELRSSFKNFNIHDLELVNLRESVVLSNENGLASLLIRMSKEKPERYEEFKKIIGKMLPSFSSITNIVSNSGRADEKSTENQFYLVLLKEKNIDGSLSLKTISAGDLKTIFIIASILNMKEGSTIIFEEIENGLHIERIRDLIGRLDDFSNRQGIQILFSTHSPYAINRLRPQDVLFVRKDNNGTHIDVLGESKQLTELEEFLEKGGDLAEYLLIAKR